MKYGRRPQYFFKWKMTSILCYATQEADFRYCNLILTQLDEIWKTTFCFQTEDDPNSFLLNLGSWFWYETLFQPNWMKYGRWHHFFENGRLPQFILNARLLHFFFKWKIYQLFFTGKRHQFFWKRKTSILLKIGRPKLFFKWKETSILLKMEDDINFVMNQRRPNFFWSNGRKPQYSCECKTTSKIKKQTMQPKTIALLLHATWPTQETKPNQH